MNVITLTTLSNVLRQAGVTPEEILAEAGLTKEQALSQVAKDLNLELPGSGPVSNGQTVDTVDGQSKAAILSEGDAQKLAAASEVLGRIFG